MALTETILERFATLRVLVVGDVMLDRFVYGAVNRISPEAPTPVILADRLSEALGGAGNVATNLTSLGARCVLVGIKGEDEAGAAIARLMEADARLDDATLCDRERCSTLKIRFVSPQHNTHLLRADWESSAAIGSEIEAKVIARIAAQLPNCDAVIVSDYGKGLLTSATITAVIDLARAAGRPVVIDPKGIDYARYRGATVVTPNLMELGLAVERRLRQSDEEIDASARSLMSRSGVENMVVKRSEHGAQIVATGAPSEVIPATARRVVDVSGAGDTFVAALTLALAAGATLLEAGRIGNAAGGLVVEKRGTASLSLAELREFLIPRPAVLFPRKILTDWQALGGVVRAWRANSLTIGFANGCFDLLHPGHVFLLSEARARVDKLVVALNADDSVRRLKGKDRPIQNESARLAVMAALEAVDAVTLFAQDTPYELIKAIEPDVLFKGADYRLADVVGRDIVEGRGGRVDLIDLVPDNSTTGMVARISSSGASLSGEAAGGG